MYNELKAAYNELWNAKALDMFSKPFNMLEEDQIAEVRKVIPFVISESEPVDLGGLAL